MADVRLEKYPVIDCSTLDVYGNQSPEEKFANALDEYETNFALQESGQLVRYAGYVQCFCDKKFSQGDSADQGYGPNGD